MIFVTVGTNEARFDRLLRGVERIRGSDVIVQYGCSTFHPKNAECFPFVTFEQLVEYMRAASVVVTHAGVGSVAVALANGQRPVVVPRLQRYGEAVDDHQLMLGRRLAQNGLVTLVEEPETLGELEIESAVLPHPGPMSANLVDDLSAHIHKFVQARESFSKLGNSATVSGGGRGNWLRPR